MRKIQILLLLIAIALLATGVFYSRKLYDESHAMDEALLAAGITNPYVEATDREIVADTTFGGIARENGKLYSTYNRLAEAEKRPCPT